MGRPVQVGGFQTSQFQITVYKNKWAFVKQLLNTISNTRRPFKRLSDLNHVIRSRQPRWRRSSRLRKSIAVMDPRPTNSCQPQPPVRSASANEISPILTPNPAMSRTRSSSCCRGGDYGVSSNPEGGGGGNMSKAFSSVDNLLEPAASEEDARFLKKVSLAINL